MKRAGLLPGIVCLIGIISAGLAGCSSYVPQTSYSAAALKSTNLPALPIEISSLQVSKTTLSAQGLELQVEAQVQNRNPFIVNIEKPQMLIQSLSGSVIGESAALGSKIGEKTVQSFFFNSRIPAPAFGESNLNLKVDLNSEYNGSAAPVSRSTPFNLREVLNKVLPKPTVYLQARYVNLSWNGRKPLLEAQTWGIIRNPTPFDLTSSVTVKFQDGQGKTINSALVDNPVKVAPNSEQPFEKHFTLPLETLNDRRILVTAEAEAGILSSFGSMKTSTPVNPYKLGDLIITPQMVLEPRAVFTGNPTLNTLRLTIDTTLINNNPFGLTVGEMTIKVNKTDNNLIGTATQSGFSAVIPPFTPQKVTNLVSLPINSVAEVSGDVTISASLPVGIEGLTDKALVTSKTTYTIRP